MCIFHFHTTYAPEHPGKHGKFRGGLRHLNALRGRAARFLNVQAETHPLQTTLQKPMVFQCFRKPLRRSTDRNIACAKIGSFHFLFSRFFVPLMLKTSHGLTVFHVFRAIGVKKIMFTYIFEFSSSSRSTQKSHFLC